MITALLDWWFSEWSGPWFDEHAFKLLPTWPVWLCARFTNHRIDLEWADYNADIGGRRCRCGQEGTK